MPDTITDAERLALGRALEQISAWARRETVVGVLPSTTLTTLDRLDRNGPMRITDLAEAEGVSQPGMTTLVHRLERHGWATRSTPQTDRRAALVAVTPEGVAAVAAHRLARATQIADRLGAIPAEDRRRLLDALPAILRITGTSASEITDTREAHPHG